MEAHRHAPGMGMVDGQEVVFRLDVAFFQVRVSQPADRGKDCKGQCVLEGLLAKQGAKSESDLGLHLRACHATEKPRP